MLKYVRIVLGGIVIASATAGFLLGDKTALSGFFLNIATEAIGIMLTVEIVDRLLKRQERREGVSKMAWRILHEIDYAVWVWHGGRREFGIGELLTILRSSSNEHTLHPATRSLMSQLGNRARNTLDTDTELIRSRPELGRILHEMTALQEHADHGDVPNVRTRDVLLDAVKTLMTILSLPEELAEPELAKWLADPSPERQLERLKRSS